MEVTLDALEADPHPILRRLRDEEPVAWVPNLGMWLVTRWDDVAAVHADGSRFTAATVPSLLRDALGESILTQEGPEHDRVAGALRPPLSGADRSPWAQQSLVAWCDRLIDGFGAAGRADLLTGYAEPVAAETLVRTLGLGDVSWQDGARWCRGLCAGIANMEHEATAAARADAARAELGEAVAGALAGARRHGDGSALSWYASTGLTEEEIVGNVRLMFSGGLNEPRDGIATVMWVLLTEPELMRAVGAGRGELDRAVLRRVVEETLRLHSPVGTSTRQTTRPTSLAGVEIPAGDIVSAVLSSANRDERHWSAPDRFVLDRREGPHLAFAAGAHRCLGEWLGRRQILVGVERLLLRLPALRLEGDVAFHGFEFRGPAALPAAWR